MTRTTPTRHKRRTRIVSAAVLTAALAGGLAAPAQAADDSDITPKPDAWGRFYVDAWATNTTANTTPETNAAIGLLSPMLDYWTPEVPPTAAFDANGKFLPESVGTVKNRTVLDANIAEAARITQTRTATQATNAYLTDRRNQNYTAIVGLGEFAQAFRAGTNAGTSIPDQIPADATTVKYDDAGNAKGAWADSGTTYGAMVDLVNQFRNSSASTNPSKAYYNYARPFRWSDAVQVLPTLMPAKRADADALADGGYPSGHTNAGWLASLALAYATPEKFQQLLTNASEIGNSRIVAGMHSPADVIGGRIQATAVSAAALNLPANAALKQAARESAKALLATTPAGADPLGDRASNEKLYEARLTYGLPRVGVTTAPAVVPKGAEVLLESRLPYLTADQRRWVLQSTAIGSGYALLDDSEGWGRLNLFAAADGYSAFDTDVAVTMNAADGSFSAADTWRNDIDGIGSLTKNGTGALTLAGTNSYTGGTVVDGGSIVASSATALGAGNVRVAGGDLAENVAGPVVIGGTLDVAAAGDLDLTVGSSSPALTVAGRADVAGSLRVAIAAGYTPADDQIIATFAGAGSQVDLDNVDVTGLPAGYTPAVELRNGALHLVNTTPTLEALTPGTPTVAGTVDGSPVVGAALTVTPGDWAPAPVAFGYQWLRGGQEIAGATGASYTPTAADLGQTLSVAVTGTKDGFSAQTRVAEASGVVVAAAGDGSSSATPTPGAGAGAGSGNGSADGLAATGATALPLLTVLALALLGLGGALVAFRSRLPRAFRSLRLRLRGARRSE